MRLIDLLDRSEALEKRVAALYHRFASTQVNDPELEVLWNELAAEEDAHAASIRDARGQLTPAERDLSGVSGCEAAIMDIAERLTHAEAIAPDATPDRKFSTALDIELSELESLRQLALHATGVQGTSAMDQAHGRTLADIARRRSRDAHVRLGAALLLARQRLAADAAARREGARSVGRHST